MRSSKTPLADRPVARGRSCHFLREARGRPAQGSACISTRRLNTDVIFWPTLVDLAVRPEFGTVSLCLHQEQALDPIDRSGGSNVPIWGIRVLPDRKPPGGNGLTLFTQQEWRCLTKLGFVRLVKATWHPAIKVRVNTREWCS